MKPEIYRAVIDEAHKRGLRVASHLYYGMTPMQALVAATGGGARVTKLDANLGTLQPGKWADFVVLTANPLTDIKNTRQIESVWIGGQRLRSASTSSR